MSDDLLIKFLLRETDPKEDEQVRHWLSEDPENIREFERFELIWNKSKQLESESRVDPEQAWKKFQQRIPENQNKGILRKLGWSSAWLRVAAVLFILIDNFPSAMVLIEKPKNASKALLSITLLIDDSLQ